MELLLSKLCRTKLPIPMYNKKQQSPINKGKYTSIQIQKAEKRKQAMIKWCVSYDMIHQFSNKWSHTSLLSRTPVVQNSSRVCADRFDSRRIWYPTVSPSSSPLSAATLAATDMADIRRGWVQIMLQSAPWRLSISSSRMNCGSWVVLPQPVSPDMTRTWYRKNQ